MAKTKTWKSKSLWLTIAALILTASSSLGQDDKTIVPPAPIPVQILSAKTAFISYAGVNRYFLPEVIKRLTGTPNGFYDRFYAGIKNLGRYELVSTPSEADLVFEISATSRTDLPNPDLNLRILDPKTKVVLWAFVEDAGGRKKSWDQAIARLVSDVRTIATPPANATTTPK